MLRAASAWSSRASSPTPASTSSSRPKKRRSTLRLLSFPLQGCRWYWSRWTSPSRDGVELLWGRAGRPVDAVCLNAGIGVGGRFAETELAKELHLIDLNVKSTVHLAKKAVVEMVARGNGRLLFTSSIASTQPGPYEGVYTASKSFVESFAEALRQEVADSGVTVTAPLPGPTDTPFFDKAELDDTKLGQSSKDDPALVARQGFEALMSGEEKVFAGRLRSKFMGRAGTVLPDSVMAKSHAKMSEPGSAR